jgi:BA14K-like protein
MFTLKHIGAAVIVSAIASAIVIDTADARRGGGGMRAGGFGGGGMRAGGLGGGGIDRSSFAGNRVANGGSLARVSNPIANRDLGRPGRPDMGLPGRPGNRPDVGLPGRPGNRPGWGWGGGGWGGDYWPGYGWGAAAVGAGLAYTAANADYCDPYYASDGYCNSGYGSYGYGSYGYGSYPPAYDATAGSYDSDAIADCARRFRSYDPASQTYRSYSGERISCP